MWSRLQQQQQQQHGASWAGAVSRPKLLRVENSWRQNPIFVFVLHPLENEISSSLRVKPKIKQTLNSQIWKGFIYVSNEMNTVFIGDVFKYYFPD